MTQDTSVKARYEHEQAARKAQREETAIDDAINEDRLHADNHLHQEGVLESAAEMRTISAGDVKEAYELLPEFHHDELRQIRIIESGVRLHVGSVFVDLRDRGHGERVAHGEETVGSELLVSKRETDYVIWNKILGTSDAETADPENSEPDTLRV